MKEWIEAVKGAAIEFFIGEWGVPLIFIAAILLSPWFLLAFVLCVFIKIRIKQRYKE